MASEFNFNTGQPTGGQSPILDVEWTLKQWIPDSTTYDAGTEKARTTMRAKLQFEDLNVLATTGEPYVFPIAEISIPYTDPGRSSGGTRWEALSSSGRKVFGRPFDLNELVGKRQRWAQKEYALRQQLVNEDGTPMIGPDGRAQWGDVMSLAWQIISVEGIQVDTPVSAGDIWEYMADACEGLDEPTFYQKLIGDQKVTPFAEIVSQVTGRSLVTNMVNMGKITRDPTGILHKAG